MLGAQRVLYAMDYPYQFVPEEVAVTDNLHHGLELFLSAAESIHRLRWWFRGAVGMDR